MGRLRTLAPRVAELRPAGPAPLTVSATLRTRGRAWQEIRRQVMTRDRGLCQACKLAGRVALASEVDHREALADGGADTPGNLQSLCTPCHLAKTRAEAARRAGQQAP